MPPWVYDRLAKHQLDARYALSSHVNPFYLHGDFNGDHKLDIAILVKEKSSQKVGIVVLHAETNAFFVLGAAGAIGDGGDDFGWMDAWYVYHRAKVRRGASGLPPPMLHGDALYVQKTEAASALLYWNGSTYAWYQQGD